MAMTNEELLIDIEGISERIRQHRIERGLSPKPKRIEPFVSVPLAMAIMDRLEPFVRIAVKYAALLADGVIHRLDTVKFAKYREYAELLQFTGALWCKWSGGGTTAILRTMDVINESADEDVHLPDMVRRLHFFIKMLRYDVGMNKYDYVKSFPREQERVIYDDLKRVESDTGVFTAAYAEARRQYDLIKGDNDNYECE